MKAALGLGSMGRPEKQRMYRDLNEGRKIDPWRKEKCSITCSYLSRSEKYSPSPSNDQATF